MDLRIIINLLDFKLDSSHQDILSNKTGKKKNMDAEGQTENVIDLPQKEWKKKKTNLSWFIFLLHKLCFFLSRKSYELKTHLKHWHAML